MKQTSRFIFFTLFLLLKVMWVPVIQVIHLSNKKTRGSDIMLLLDAVNYCFSHIVHPSHLHSQPSRWTHSQQEHWLNTLVRGAANNKNNLNLFLLKVPFDKRTSWKNKWNCEWWKVDRTWERGQKTVHPACFNTSQMLLHAEISILWS